MIDPQIEAVFPNNVVVLLAEAFTAVDEDAVVFTRPLRPSDPSYSIGVYGALWTPNDDSYEMRGSEPPEPTIGEYQIGIQTMIKDGDTERALATGSIFSKRVRTMLYRNNPLRVALGSLYVQDAGFTERMKRQRIRTQRFMSNDVEGQFVFISVLDYSIETEVM